MYGDGDEPMQEDPLEESSELDSGDDVVEEAAPDAVPQQNPESEGVQNSPEPAQQHSQESQKADEEQSPSQKTVSSESGRNSEQMMPAAEEERKSSEDTDEDDEPALEPTHLGNAIDSLMMHWCQLLTNVSVKAPVPPPSTLDHVKEVAEVCSKHFRDASVDVTNEFMRIGVQWEMEQANEQFANEEEHLDEVIERQELLLNQIREMLARRVNIYKHENPNAGKHFTT